MGAAGLAALSADGVRQSAKAPHADAPRTPSPPGPRPRAIIHPKPTPSPRAPSWSPNQHVTAVKPKTPIRDLSELVPAPPPKTIALTIDDGPSPLYTPKVLDILAENEIHATFFIIGEQVKEFPKTTRRIADAGHQVCNHTMTHPLSLGHLSTKQVRKEIVEAHDRIAQVTGIVPTFFRAPGGNWSKATMDTIAEHGMLPIDWAVDPRDWSRPGVGHIRRTLLTAKAGNILLCHDGGGDRSQTMASLKTVIPKLKKRGLTFVAL
ncbi:polysaccharide deacetylase family protein [Actinomadura barringtoniae]|uniref:Polysaccharide deacetylase family protein n=2 Tax=Actinomadura barringtoniae TaxID=1427535 RepID=A0A939TAX0_9ACTN|nr:polysaccharide deacetylase family protein [Actinomadura barringtoniae]